MSGRKPMGGLRWTFSRIAATFFAFGNHICFSCGVLSVVTTFVAQAHGAQDSVDVRKAVETGMILVIPLSVLLVGLIPLLPFVQNRLHLHQDILVPMSVYLRWMLWASPLFLLNFTIIGFFRGIGDTITPMIITLAIYLVNVILDFAVVLGWWGLPRMGVHGVALATVISMAIASIAYVVVYVSSRHHSEFCTRRLPRTHMVQVQRFLRIGIPIGISWLLENMAFMVMTLYIGRFEPALSAANTIVFQLCHVSFMPAVAISIAASALVGRYIGALRSDLARASAHRTVLLSVSYMGVLGLIFLPPCCFTSANGCYFSNF